MTLTEGPPVHGGQKTPPRTYADFLGVRFDHTLSFGQCIKDIKAKMGRRANTLRAVSGKAWGANTSDFRALHLAYIRACTDYATACWMPGVAPANLEHLEVAQ